MNLRCIGAIAIATMVATACGSAASSPPGAPAGPSGTVQLMVQGDAEELAAYRELVEAFEAQDDRIDVQLIEASGRGDLMTRMSTAFAGGNPPELFLLNYRFIGQFASQGVLESLDDRIAASPTLDLADFYPAAVESFRFDGELPCLAQNISSLAVYYNEDLFAEAGVPVPEDGWAWNTMVEAATALTIDEDGDGQPEQYGLGVDAGQIIRLAPFVWSAGGELVDDRDDPRSFALDTPEARLAVSSFFSLRRGLGVVPTEEEVESEDLESRFMNGTVAMLMESRRATPGFRTITDFEWDFAPLPTLGEPAGILHSDGFCMTKGSANQDAAWAFTEWALGEPGQRILAASGRTVPSLRSVAESDVFLDPGEGPANSHVWLDQAEYARAVPNISTWAEIESLVGPVLEIAMYEEVDVGAFNDQLNALAGDLFTQAAGRD
jgi:multiple sugar transport system substrate-binding protein